MEFESEKHKKNKERLKNPHKTQWLLPHEVKDISGVHVILLLNDVTFLNGVVFIEQFLLWILHFTSIHFAVGRYINYSMYTWRIKFHQIYLLKHT